MHRSASAAIVNEGLARPVDPSISAPSTTYSPGQRLTRPATSHALPSTAPPSGCADTAGLNEIVNEPVRWSRVASVCCAAARKLATRGSVVGQFRPTRSVSGSYANEPIAGGIPRLA